MGNRRDHRLDNAEQRLPPHLEFLFEGQVAFSEPLEIGTLAAGQRLAVSVEPGGRIDGPRMHGKHLPGSTVVELVRADGVVEIDGQLFIGMDDGSCIVLRSKGILFMSAETANGLAEGGAYDPSSVYARAFVTFEAADDGPYAWLNRGLYLLKGTRTVDGGSFSIWKVL